MKLFIFLSLIMALVATPQVTPELVKEFNTPDGPQKIAEAANDFAAKQVAIAEAKAKQEAKQHHKGKKDDKDDKNDKNDKNDHGDEKGAKKKGKHHHAKDPKAKDDDHDPKANMGNMIARGCNGSSVESSSEETVEKANPPSQPPAKLQLSDFEIVRSVGRGSFGRVSLVRRKNNSKTYALKYINKDQCVRQNAVRNIINERRLLERINYSLICNLQAAFQDDNHMYLLLDPMLGGDLGYHLERVGTFTEDIVCFFIAEVALGLEYLHKRHIVHRDIKPANILLDERGHCHLTDFNVAGRLHSDRPMRTTAGTFNYIAPEVFKKSGYNERVDWWSLGVTMFECLYGKPPFRGKSRPEIREAVLKHEICYPKKNTVTLSADCKSALYGFLQPEPNKRLGPVTPLPYRAHVWFTRLNFAGLESKTVLAPFQPDTASVKKDTAFVLEEALMGDQPLKQRKDANSGKHNKEESVPGSPWFIMREEFTEFDRSQMRRSLPGARASAVNGHLDEADKSPDSTVDEEVMCKANLDVDEEDAKASEKELKIPSHEDKGDSVRMDSEDANPGVVHIGAGKVFVSVDPTPEDAMHPETPNNEKAAAEKKKEPGSIAANIVISPASEPDQITGVKSQDMPKAQGVDGLVNPQQNAQEDIKKEEESKPAAKPRASIGDLLAGLRQKRISTPKRSTDQGSEESEEADKVQKSPEEPKADEPKDKTDEPSTAPITNELSTRASVNEEVAESVSTVSAVSKEEKQDIEKLLDPEPTAQIPVENHDDEEAKEVEEVKEVKEVKEAKEKRLSERKPKEKKRVSFKADHEELVLTEATTGQEDEGEEEKTERRRKSRKSLNDEEYEIVIGEDGKKKKKKKKPKEDSEKRESVDRKKNDEEYEIVIGEDGKKKKKKKKPKEDSEKSEKSEKGERGEKRRSRRKKDGDDAANENEMENGTANDNENEDANDNANETVTEAAKEIAIEAPREMESESANETSQQPEETAQIAASTPEITAIKLPDQISIETATTEDEPKKRRKKKKANDPTLDLLNGLL